MALAYEIGSFAVERHKVGGHMHALTSELKAYVQQFQEVEAYYKNEMKKMKKKAKKRSRKTWESM